MIDTNRALRQTPLTTDFCPGLNSLLHREDHQPGGYLDGRGNDQPRPFESHISVSEPFPLLFVLLGIRGTFVPRLKPPIAVRRFAVLPFDDPRAHIRHGRLSFAPISGIGNNTYISVE